MCEAMVITFDEGAIFVAARGVEPDEIARIHRTARFVTGNEVLALPHNGAIFQQVSDSVSQELIEARSGLKLGDPQELTPEDLVDQGFPAQAIINGLRAARPLTLSKQEVTPDTQAA